MVGEWKEEKKPTSMFCLGLALVWVHPKTAKTASSTTGALVGVGSQQSWKAEKKTISFSVAHLCICGWGFSSNPFFLCWITELPQIKPRQFIFMTNRCETYEGVLNWVELSLTKIVQFSITLCTVGLNIMKPPQCNPPSTQTTTHWGISNNYPEHDNKRLDSTIPGDRIATNKTKQTTFLSRDRASTCTSHSTHRWLRHKLCYF